MTRERVVCRELLAGAEIQRGGGTGTVSGLRWAVLRTILKFR